jgi:hypothetical protein
VNEEIGPQIDPRMRVIQAAVAAELHREPSMCEYHRTMNSPQYDRNRPPEDRGFDLHNRDDGPASPGRMSSSALMIAMAIIVVAVIALVVFVFLR